VRLVLWTREVGVARCLWALALLVCLPARADDPALRREYAVKAAFVFQMLRYVEWPASDGEEFVVGVLGEDPFGRTLDTLAERSAPTGQPIRVVRFGRLQDVTGCRILFIARSEREGLASVLARLSRQPILLLGDTAGFAERGVHVNFYLSGDRVRFEINLEATRRARLKISAKLLRLARIIVEPEET
jgi:hypothetical protein